MGYQSPIVLGPVEIKKVSLKIYLIEELRNFWRSIGKLLLAKFRKEVKRYLFRFSFVSQHGKRGRRNTTSYEDVGE